MMYLDSQNAFSALMDKAVHSQPVQIDAPYADAYKEWEEKNKEILYRLSADERTESFSDFVEERRKEKVEKLIEEKLAAMDASVDALKEEKTRLTSLNKKGQVILASRDGGKTLDTLLTKKDLKNLKPENFAIFSPTLTSQTTDLNQVVDEQTLLHVAQNLKREHFLIKSAATVDGQVQIEAVHPKTGECEVKVDCDADPNTPLEYVFVKGTTEKHIAETALPEEYGEIEPDKTLRPQSIEEIISTHITKTGENAAEIAGETARNAFIATAATVVAANKALQGQKVMNVARANSAMMAAKQAMLSPLNNLANGLAAGMASQNVMVSKAAVLARVARKTKELEEGKKHEAELQKKYMEDSEKARLEKARKSQEQSSQGQKQGMSTGSKIALGTGAAGALFGALGLGGMTFITIQNNLLL